MAKQGQGQAPETLEEWLSARPSWLRAAAQGLLGAGRKLSDDEVDALASHCLDEAGDRLAEGHAPIAPGAVLGTSSGVNLRINRIHDIHGVNALSSRAELNLAQADLTVVYGGNGSGKSGYARLVKHICGARAAEPIHGNVFSNASEPVSARVVVSREVIKDGQTVVKPFEVEWHGATGPVPWLNAIHVFDTATATEMGHGPHNASHLPRALRFIEALIATSDRVAGNLKVRASQLVKQLPTMPPAFAGTAAATFYGGLASTMAVRAINEGCHISDDQRAERVALEAALAQADPAAGYAKVIRELERVTKLVTDMGPWAASFDDVRARSIVAAREAAVAKRGAAQQYADRFFESMPLPGVGEEAWRYLWGAAARYAQERAYPGHAHPNLDEGARCVLCQQHLAPDANLRMANFADYVANHLEADAVAAERALGEWVASVPETPNSDYWASVGASIGLGPEAVTALGRQVADRLAALRGVRAVAQAPLVAWEDFNAAAEDRLRTLAAERDALAGLMDPAGRQQRQTRLIELQAQEWLAQTRDAVAAEVERLKLQAVIEKAVRLTHTATLTTRANEIAEAELAGGFRERFHAELARLGGGTIPVEMNYKLEGKGKVTFSVALAGAGKIKNREVLSEGEQRIVALSAFFADVSASDRELPVIFDDPISSLDQRYEEAVAGRLVELAASRQVIVFTHRISLGVLISGAAEQRKDDGGSKVSVHIASIDRDGNEAGVPASIDVFAVRPKTGLDELLKRVTESKALDLDLRKLVLKASCSNFRILVERSIEDHLCSKVIVRFRRSITTLERLPKLAAIDIGDCRVLDHMMTKYSAFEHSQAYETPVWLPDADELITDIQAMTLWIADFDKRAKAMV
ncbi:hypothetical protein [Dyella sp. 333MFSha]|uniref:AAA family ATPase n=1 Tax=Dyella sp. 333MFSha TaxID=1798240 RepID=UPI00088A3A5D|nr:hypothetical protein [Dyella sp. 333MFSha]SDF26813.1 hypothetical protein SAMN04515659_0546 [Dyella sp. 333MFSha]